MRAVLQRVTRASARVGGETVGEIAAGLVVLLGVARDDAEEDARYLAEKTVTLRVFDDEEGRMNRSVVEAGGGLLVVSQFTLYGDARKGRRPSWFDAASPETAERLYELFMTEASRSVARVAKGVFRSMMEVELVNDGPVTILLDSRKLF
ncbi:MAG TPA: D-aminoacyl-tRNA deacylase [Pyrinomonadaceae bacterium]|nr:D-aminoacyl-tRNA deacylase [Pyrinomonadaceae bacterium]